MTMNKYIYMFAATGLVLAGCSNNDVRNDIEENEVEIGFTSVQNKPTKAEITDNAALATEGGFVVWGYKAKTATPMVWTADAYTVFDAVNVKKKTDATSSDYIDGDNTNWTYDTKKYWDKNASYCFYAVAPFSPSSGTYSIAGTNDAKMITITGAKSGLASASDDFLVARGGVKSRVGTNTANVDFVFHHTMAKVDFLLKKATGVDAEVKVQSIKMTGWNSGDGTFVQTLDATPNTLVCSEWSIPTAGTGEVSILSAETAALETTAAKSTTQTYIMVPQNIAAETLTFTIDYTVAGEPFKAHVGKIEAAQVWGTDSHITYTLTIGPKTIEFDVKSICNFDVAGTGAADIQ